MSQLRDLASRIPGLKPALLRLYFLPRDAGYRWGPRLMSRLRKWWVIARNPHATIKFTEPVYLGPGFSLHMPEGGTFVCAEGVEFRRGFRAEIGAHGRITIGAGCYFTYDPILSCNTSIDIGERCGIGQGAYIVDGSHRFRDLDKPFRAQGYDYRPIVIEDDVQIHSKVTVVNSIGERAIIAANAVITKPIPPFTVAGGVPARVLDYYGPPGGEPPGWKAKAGEGAT